MDHTEHRALIDQLLERLSESAFRECWPLVKTIGQAFRDTRYPTRQEKDLEWSRFQATVADLKSRQDEYWDKRNRRSEEYRRALLLLADASSPDENRFFLALNEQAHGVIGGLVDAGLWMATLGFLKPEPTDPRLETLKSLSSNNKKAWEKFKEEQKNLNREHHQEVFERLKEVSAELDNAWREFKGQRQVEYEERKGKRNQQTSAFLERLESRLANQKAYLEKKESELSDLKEKQENARGESYRDRVGEWIEQCESKISEVETDIRQLEEKIDEVKGQLG
jgi:hypothetical protein